MSVRLELEATKPQTVAPHYIVPSKIEELPQDLLDKIFSYLNKQDLQALASVNWCMNRSVKEAANRNERSSIRNFIEILLKRLNAETFSTQREKLIKISEYIASKNFANLILLKRHILDMKAELIDVIKTLNQETENDLSHDVQPPHFLEDIFELATIERRIDEAKIILDEEKRGLALRDISIALMTQADNIKRGIEVAMSMPTLNMIDNTFEKILESLIGSGKLDKAFEVVNAIPDEETKGYALSQLSRTLAITGDIETAIEVVMSSCKEEGKCGKIFALWTLCLALSCMTRSRYYKCKPQIVIPGNFDKAIAFAISISAESMKDCEESKSLLLNICEILTYTDNIDSAIKIAALIPSECDRGHALTIICDALLHNGNIDKAIEVVMLISDDNIRNKNMRDKTLIKIAKKLEPTGNFEKGIEVVMLISDEKMKGNALSAISIALIQNGNIDKGIEVTNAIPDKDTRWITRRDVYDFLEQNRNIDKAMEVATLSANELIKEPALWEIFKAAIQSCNIL